MTNSRPLISIEQNSVLVLIDIQDRLIAAMPKGVHEHVIEQNTLLLTTAKILSVPVMVTEQYPKGLGSTVSELTSLLDEHDPMIEKTSFSCVKAAGFLDAITSTKRRQIILTGMETHICVLQTALALQQQGFQVFVVEDAASSRSKINHCNALQRLRHAGVIITTVESLVFEWLGDAKHPYFKTVAKLIV